MKKRPKDLNMSRTYVNDIFQKEPDSKYEGLLLIPSRTASREMVRLGMRIADCKRVLVEGYEQRKRAKDTIERCIDRGNKTFNVVVVKSFNMMYDDYVYLITHVGKFTRRK